MIFNEGRPIRSKSIPEFTYTGRSKFVDEGSGNWHIDFLTSGMLTFQKLGSASNVDLCAVGGGNKGEPGVEGSSIGKPSGGRGGNGGEVKTVRDIRLKKTDKIVVTVGASNEDTKIIRNTDSDRLITAFHGSGGNGGHGGEAAYEPAPGESGALEFEEGPRKLGGGGGGGAEWSAGSGAAGKDGGGTGASYANDAGPGADGTGGGGGGGSGGYGGPPKQGAPGGRGIGIMRNARKST